MNVELRPYQNKGISEVFSALQQGSKKIILVLAMGLGKTTLMGRIIQLGYQKERKILIVVHRDNLVRQFADRLREQFNVPSGYILGSEKKDYTFPIQVASRQSLSRRLSVFPPDHFDLMIIDECFTGETEILTDKGFIRFDQLQKTEKIAQYNKDGSISFVDPIRHIKRDHNGEMGLLHLYRGIKMPITLGHNQPFVNATTGDITFKQIKDWKFTNKLVIVSGKSNIQSEKLTAIERLLIATQADGSLTKSNLKGETRVYFQFTKERKIERLKQLCQDAKTDCRPVCKNIAAFGNRKEKRKFMVTLPFAITKDITNHIKFPMSSDKAKEIIEEMVHWNGSIIKENHYYYSSKDKKQTDFYFQVAILAGHRCYQITQKGTRKESYCVIHRLFIQKNTQTESVQKFKLERYNYNGQVYCVEVPSGMIIIKHNGYAMVTGNCHYAAGPEYQKIIKQFESAKVVGVTATPFRSDGKPLNKIFDKLVHPITCKEAIDQGHLCSGVYYGIGNLNMDGVTITRKGDYDEGEMYSRFSEWDITPHVVKELAKFSGQTIIFCINVAHTKEVYEAVKAAGYNVEYVVGESEISKRNEIYKKFKEKKIQVLVNCEILTEGADFPEIENVFLVRKTKSLARYLQIVGRGSRTFQDGLFKKTFFNVVDFGGNVVEHGYFEDYDEGLQLETGAEKKMMKRKPKKCPGCGKVILIKECSCGYVFEEEIKEKIQIDHLEIEVLNKNIINYLRLSKKNWEKVKDHELRIYAKIKGMKPGWALHEYARRHQLPKTGDWNYFVNTKLIELEKQFATEYE